MTEKERSLCKMKWFQEALQHEHIRSEGSCSIEDVPLPVKRCVFCLMANMEASFRKNFGCKCTACFACIFAPKIISCNSDGAETYQELVEMGERGGKERSHE